MKWLQIIEALLFSSPRGLTAREILSALRSDRVEALPPAEPPPKTDEDIQRLIEELAHRYAAEDHAFELVCVNGRWQLLTRPEFGPWVQALTGEKPRPGRLSPAALETLTIIAYRQPITRAEIEEIRGVSIDGVLQTLLERGLVRVVGKAELPGRPLLYGTTDLFLEAFGLKDLSELPEADQFQALAGVEQAQTQSDPEVHDRTEQAPSDKERSD